MVTELIFFDDFSTFSRCAIQARKLGIKTTAYIVQCLEKNLPSNDHKKAMDLWIACSDQAKSHRISVAAFIESCCRKEIEDAEKPEQAHRSLWSWFDLNYDQKEVKK